MEDAIAMEKGIHSFLEGEFKANPIEPLEF